MEHSVFVGSLLRWYHQNKRILPWRETDSPYRIWLSEIILQQTRVDQGLPYYHRFTSQYPDVKSLALAPLDDVLRLWQGLGYYTRARNLHKCAQKIYSEYNGEFPGSYKELLKLPGVGPYTAAAIASIAFNEPVPVVDGNVIRVMARLYGMESNFSEPSAIKQLFDFLSEIIPAKTPDEFNQAIMEFGALYCKPANPDCDRCIFNDHCAAYMSKKVDELPIKRKKPKIKARYFYYYIIKSGEKYLMRSRQEKDIWHGLYEPYLIETKHPVDLKNIETLLRNELSGDVSFQIEQVTPARKHILTHQNIFFHIICVSTNNNISNSIPDTYKWYSLHDIEALPKPVLIANFFNENIF